MKNFIKLISIFILIILIIFLIYNYIFLRIFNKLDFEKTTIELSQNLENCPFSISKIILYSSAYGENKNTTFEKSNWILDIYQYTDIAIYIDNNSNELNENNSIKSFYIDNILLDTPKLGNSNLYYLDSLKFGTETINKSNSITDKLEYTIINDSNSDNWAKTNTPVFFTDCSNPITLKYVNKPVIENYIYESKDPLFFNGQLLNLSKIDLNDLNTKINLTLNIKSNSNNFYYYNLSIPIDLNENNELIENGQLYQKFEYNNNKFIPK